MRSSAGSRKLLRNTSAPAIKRSTTSRPTAVWMSSEIDRLPAFTPRNWVPTAASGRRFPTLRYQRFDSPPGGSTLITSAPKPARSPPAAGPCTATDSSTTRIPSNGSIGSRSKRPSKRK